MNNDLLAVLDYLERDRGLEREVITRVIEEALESAAKKSMGPNDLKVSLNPKTGDITATATVTVVEEVDDPETEMSAADARAKVPDAKVGDSIEIDIPPQDLGRIVAQTTRQGIFQRLRQVEKELVREEYRDRVGEVLYGVVTRFEKGDVVVDFSGHEGILPHGERIPTEDYQVGDHVACVLIEINDDRPGPVLRVSRAHETLVRELFAREVTEIAEGIVEIKAVAREPGYRSKIAVHSNDAKVDPVGACVGIRGSRVKAIVRELSGEKVDIVRWDDDVKSYIAKALQPAEIKDLTIDEESNQVTIWVDPDQLSLAIGKRGQNARLTAKLTGWKIDIKKIEVEEEITFEEKVNRMTAALVETLEISEDAAKLLVDNGFLTIEGIRAADKSDLMAIDGIDEDTADQVIQQAAEE